MHREDVTVRRCLEPVPDMSTAQAAREGGGGSNESQGTGHPSPPRAGTLDPWTLSRQV